MGRQLRKGILFTLLLACAAPAAALDPLLMLLMSVAREAMQARSRAAPVVVVPDPARIYPGTSVEPDHLRSLIDDSFHYLSESQRREVFEALHAQLSDPKNAAVRASMIEYFATRALNIRAAQRHLQQLSTPEKERLADEFKKGIATLPAEEQEQLGELLRQGLLPLPGDLNQLLLAAFESR